MIREINLGLLISTLIVGAGILMHPAQAGTPEGKNTLRIHTGRPLKSGETIVSVTARWRIDESLQYGSTGLTFINGPDHKSPDDGNSVARKVGGALKEGMIKQYPKWRGVVLSYNEDINDPQLVLKNKEGMSFTELTFRDYTNQKFTSEIGGQSFASDGVQFSIDIAESKAVDVTPLWAPATTSKSTFRAEGGGIDVSIGSKTASIDTANKTTSEIEKSLAGTLGGVFSTSPLYPKTEDADARNIKPFDKGELQFRTSSAKSFTIDINDPSLGIITKYKFKDDNQGVSRQFTPYVPYMFLAVGIAFGGYYGRQYWLKKHSEDGDQV